MPAPPLASLANGGPFKVDSPGQCVIATLMTSTRTLIAMTKR